MDKFTKEELEQNFKNGLWHKEIAEKYHVSQRVIYQRVKDWGLVIPRKNGRIKTEVICSCCGKKYKSLKNGNICGRCLSKQQNIEKDEFLEDGSSPRRSKIQELRKQGLSYDEIAEQLHCAKSTISYYCSKTTRDKAKIKHKTRLKNKEAYTWRVKLSSSIYNFCTRKPGKGYPSKIKDWHRKLQTAISRFKLKGVAMENRYTVKDAIKYFGGTTTKCYLTGQTIDILKDDYNLDHIVPISKGGTNDLKNMGITIPDANRSKSDLTLDEYLALCKKVLENFGYTVIKNN